MLKNLGFPAQDSGVSLLCYYKRRYTRNFCREIAGICILIFFPMQAWEPVPSGYFAARCGVLFRRAGAPGLSIGVHHPGPLSDWQAQAGLIPVSRLDQQAKGAGID